MDEECKSWVTRTNFSRTIYHRLDSATLPQLDLEHGSKKPKNPNNSSDHSNLFNSISLPNDIGIRQSSMDSNPSSSSVHYEGDLRSDSESKQRSISLDSRSAAAQPSNLLHFLGRVSSVKNGSRKERNWGMYFDHGVGKVAAVDIADEWKVDLSQLYLGFRFAIGSNSRLYHGVYKEKNVAVKIIQVPDEDDDENGMVMAARLENQYSREVNFLSQLQHRNVIKLVAACKNPPVFCIITEYLSGGSLRAFLHKLEHEPLALQKVISIALDIARGMEYIHSQGVIHRDLKPENILLDEELCVKIADFGIACEEACSDQLSEDPGTYRWMAPEMIKHQHCGKKVDVYSFGLVLWEMVTGRVPYEDMTQIQAAFAVVDKNIRPTIPPDCPATLRTLMEQCWASVPGKRPDFRQIIKVLDQIESNIASEIMPDQSQNLTSREKKKDLRHWIQKFKGRLAGPKAL